MKIMTKLLLILLCHAVTGLKRRTQYGCEGSVLNIDCEVGTTIHLVRANYGRFSISICNRKGETDWSVNCMEPRSLRVLTERCGSRGSCTVPVNSSIFGDPCPGTFKYVEVHYNCLSPADLSTTSKEKPPWLLDLTATPEPAWQIKHLMELNMTTSPVTVTTAMRTTETVTVSETISTLGSSPTVEYETQPPVAPSTTSVSTSEHRRISVLEDINDVELTTELADVPRCPAVTSRGLFWRSSEDKEVSDMIQECPPGSSGLARWSCRRDGWREEYPDLSDCRSAWILRVQQRINQGQSILSVAADLDSLTASHPLYGGDILLSLSIIETMREILDKELESLYGTDQLESLVTSLLRSTINIGNNLLAGSSVVAWNDIPSAERTLAVSSLMREMENTAFLLVSKVNAEAVRFDQDTENIISSVRVVRGREPSSQVFPSSNHPSSVVVRGAGGGGEEGSRLTFFLYSGMDRVLPSTMDGVRFLNSDIVSVVSAGTTHHHPLTFQAEVRFAHTRANLSSPVCMGWNVSTHGWTENDCQVSENNESHTSCICHNLGTIALLALQDPAGEPLTDEIGTWLGIFLAVVISILLMLIVLMVTWKMSFRTTRDKQGVMHVSCLCKESMQDEGDYYPNVNSSPTSTTLSDEISAHNNIITGSNYCLSRDSTSYSLDHHADTFKQSLGGYGNPPSNQYQEVPSAHHLDKSVIIRDRARHSTRHATTTRSTRGSTVTGSQHPAIQLQFPREVAHVYRPKEEGVRVPTHLIPDIDNHYFRPVSPNGHIYMEIDPMYSSRAGQTVLISDNPGRFDALLDYRERRDATADAKEDKVRLRLSGHLHQCRTMDKVDHIRTRSDDSSLRYRTGGSLLNYGGAGVGGRADLETPITMILTPGEDGLPVNPP